MSSHDAIVVGAGISGLAAAHELVRDGFDVTVLEATARVGGALATEEVDGWIVEHGANTVVDREPLSTLLAELGLESIAADVGARRRYVWHDGTLHEAPRDPLSLLRTSLLSAGAKLKLAGEPWRPTSASDDESIADFARRRLGSQVLERLVAPFVAGVYAGDPERLSVRHALPRLAELETEHGSLLRGIVRRRERDRPRPISFHGGLTALPRALAAELDDLRLETPVEEIETGDDRFVVRGASETISGSRLVVAASAPEAARLLASVSGGRSEALAELPHASVVVVTLGYRRDAVAHRLDGFGFLSADPGLPLLGALFSSSLFPASAPSGHVLLSAFVGGRRRPDLVDLEETELVAATVAALDTVLGLRDRPVLARTRRWRPGIPQYEIGHDRFLDLISGIESELPGLALVGNYRDGVAVADCVDLARRTARRLMRGSR